MKISVYTLFHTVQNSKIVNVGTLVTAERKYDDPSYKLFPEQVTNKTDSEIFEEINNLV